MSRFSKTLPLVVLFITGCSDPVVSDFPPPPPPPPHTGLTCGPGLQLCVFPTEHCVPLGESCIPDMAQPDQGMQPGPDQGPPDTTGLTSGFTFSPATLDFGSIVLGNSKQLDITITLSNAHGLAHRTVQFLTLGNWGIGFSVDYGDCRKDFRQGDSCTAHVTFGPLDSGAQQTSLSVQADGFVAGSATLSGSGRAGVAKLSLSPDHWQFGPTPIKSSTTVDFVVGNDGDGSAPSLVPQLDAPSDGFDIIANGCSWGLAPTNKCTFTVRFSPIQERNDYSGTVRVSADGNAPLTAALSGSAFDAAVLQWTNPGTFTTSFAGDAPITQIFHLDNTHNDASGPLTLDITGDTSGVFSIVDAPCQSQPLAGHTGCDVKVQFAPKGRALYSAQLRVKADPGGPVVTTLQGSGKLHATLSLKSGNGAFGDDTTGFQTRLITIGNDGDEPTGTLSFDITDPLVNWWYQTPGTCLGGVALGSGQSCSVTLVWYPSTVGEHDGNFTVTAAPAKLVVPLSGNYHSDVDLVATPSTSFGTVSTKVGRMIGLHNVSLRDLGPVTVSVTGSGFSYDSDKCSDVALNSGARCTLEVLFTPTVSGTFTGSITFSAGGVSATTTLSATALVPAFVFNPGTVELGTIGIGRATDPVQVTITNTSNHDWPTTYSNSNSGLFKVATNNCPATLSLGASCTMTIQMTPSSGGDKVGTLTFTQAQGTPVLKLHGVAN